MRFTIDLLSARAPSGRALSGTMRATLSILLLSQISSASYAAKVDDRWTVHVVAGVVSTAEDVVSVAATQSGPITIGEATHGVGDGDGFGLGLEYRATRRIGIEVAYFDADHDTRFTITPDEIGPGGELIDEDTVAVKTYILGLHLHLRPDRRPDVVVGLFAGMDKAEDLFFNTEVGRREKLSFDDDISLGLKASVVVPFTSSSPWSFVGEIRYLPSILESDYDGPDLDFDPVTMAVGASYRW